MVLRVVDRDDVFRIWEATGFSGRLRRGSLVSDS